MNSPDIISFEPLHSTSEAFKEFLRECSVSLLLSTTDAGPAIGSATCVEIEDRLFVATVAHNFDKVKNFNAFSGNKGTNEALKIIRDSCDYLPDKPDVAWLEVDRKSAERSKLKGIPLERIVPDAVLNSSTIYFFTGTPAVLSKVEHVSDSPELVLTQLLMGSMLVDGIDPSADVIELELSNEPDNFIGPNEMPAPPGMSGGGIWVAEESDTLVWQVNLKLIGMGTSYFRNGNNLTKFNGVKMHHWLKLISRDLPELQPTIHAFIEPNN